MRTIIGGTYKARTDGFEAVLERADSRAYWMRRDGAAEARGVTPGELAAGYDLAAYPAAMIDALAAAFSRGLAAALTPAQLAEIRRRNASPDYAGCCASHDFCDANMVMADAAAAVGVLLAADGYLPEDTDGPEYEAGVAAWNAAWALAKAAGFDAGALESPAEK